MLVGLVTSAFALFGISLRPFAAAAIVISLCVGGAGVALVKAYNMGFASADRQAEIDKLQSQLNAAKFDRDVARSAARDAATKLDAMKENAELDKERTSAYVKELESRPAGPKACGCSIDDDDLRGMRAERRKVRTAKPGLAAQARRAFRARTKAAYPKGR